MSIVLYCFPYAGGNALVFKDWQRYLPLSIEVRPMHLPGRGRRFGEPPIGDYRQLVERLAEDVRDDFCRVAERGEAQHYALFGHSAGARFAFGVAALMVEFGRPEPLRCFLAAVGAPHKAEQEKRRSQYSDAQLTESLRRMGGTPSNVLAEPDLMALMLPAIRADFRANEEADLDRDKRVSCPFTLIAAIEDTEGPPVEVWEWEAYTTGETRRVQLAGDHFSVLREPAALLNEIRADLARTDSASERTPRVAQL